MVEGKVVLEGATLPDGIVVTVLAQEVDEPVELPPALKRKLEESLDEADLEQGISASALLDKLRKYG
ncbi:MAG: hypothetical protein ABIR94_05710 [Rubrivivax sp.]